MKTTSRMIVVIAAAGALLAFFGVRPIPHGVSGAPPEGKTEAGQKPAEGRQDIPLKEFMREKLRSSNKVLEGLVTNDPDLVRDGAEALHKMSDSEKWRVSNDVLYRQFSGEFRRITEQLVEAADKKNMDHAALRWMDATMNCVECHRYVRGIMIAESPAPQ